MQHQHAAGMSARARFEHRRVPRQANRDRVEEGGIAALFGKTETHSAGRRVRDERDGARLLRHCQLSTFFSDRSAIASLAGAIAGCASARTSAKMSSTDSTVRAANTWNRWKASEPCFSGAFASG